MIKLIIFDIDDTLLDHRAGTMEAMSSLKKQLSKFGYISESYDFSVFHNAYDKRNHTLWSQFEIGKVTISDVLKKRFYYIFDWFGIRTQHKLIFKEIFWDNYISNCHLTHDWISLLQHLQSCFYLVICSNGMKDIQLKKLEKHKIITFFDKFYFGDTYPNCKPNIDFFMRILEEFQLSPEQAIIVGDSLENDLLPCQKLGIKTLRYDGERSFKKIHTELMGKKMERDFLFKNITYFDSTCMCLLIGDIRVSAGYITALGNDIVEKHDDKVIYSSDLIVLPGMINAHLHPSKEIYGGMLDFSPIDIVLNSVHTNNSLEGNERQYIASLKSMMSALKKGVTTFGLFTSRIESDIRAAQKMGVRAVISYCQNNQWIGSGRSPESKSIEKITRQFFDVEEKYKSNLIVVCPATASELSADDDLIKKLHQIAKKFKTKFFIHMHEGEHQVTSHYNVYGMTGIERLAKLNILDSHTTLIHSCHLSEVDKSLLLLSGCNIIHCPVSNSFVGAGSLPLKELSSMTIGLGTDAAMVNPVNDITFDALMSVYHHGDNDFTKKVSASYVLKLLTEGGANSLGLAKTGRIESGFKADLIFYDKKSIDAGYINTPVSILKMLNHESPCKVMINGRIIIDNARFIDSTLFYNESKYSAIREMIKL